MSSYEVAEPRISELCLSSRVASCRLGVLLFQKHVCVNWGGGSGGKSHWTEGFREHCISEEEKKLCRNPCTLSKVAWRGREGKI